MHQNVPSTMTTARLTVLITVSGFMPKRHNQITPYFLHEAYCSSRCRTHQWHHDISIVCVCGIISMHQNLASTTTTRLPVLMTVSGFMPKRYTQITPYFLHETYCPSTCLLHQWHHDISVVCASVVISMQQNLASTTTTRLPPPHHGIFPQKHDV